MLGRFRVLVIQVLLVGHESSSLYDQRAANPRLCRYMGARKPASRGAEQSAAREMTSDRTFIHSRL